MPSHDWSHIQSFVAVAEHGSLSAAARALNSSQPTLSRHIAQLEDGMGTRLFDRQRSGMHLTRAGTDLMEHAAAMANAAGRFSVVAEGQDETLAGTVRITASRVVATFVLPDVLRDLRATHPDIAIELVSSDTTDNLLRREADIALRMYRPTQEDVITRHVCDVPLGAYAARTYVAQHGEPQVIDDLHRHRIIGYDRSTLIIDGLRAAGLEVTRDFFGIRCDDQVACWQMVVAGCGIGFFQTSVGDAEPRVQRVARDAPVGRLPMWLTAHPDLRTNPRVRRIFDALADRLSK
ncbi:MAG: LysR family transcriptional regulator [Pseudomonadota bacterium]